MSVVIESKGLSKQYRIGRTVAPYKTFREALVKAVQTPFRLLSKKADRKDDTIWALKDVSFEVNEGEVVGIIGRNGAGKSTLLKILSRITEPTEGEVRIRGRVGSLLEVGTGFHPELTGRENIFLNGAILGMRKEEIRKKFDEIVSFSEIEKFLDTPVKRYSSGMYVRLAFAVAAHLEPEILVVDEVLAVGDLQFQKKCLGKMEEVSKEGRTILLVSHNLATIMSLSTKCLLLSDGSLAGQGDPHNVITSYQNSFSKETFGRTDLSEVDRYGTGAARFQSIAVKPFGKQNEVLPIAVTGCDMEFYTTILANEDITDVTVALIIYDDIGNRLIDANTLIKGDSLTLRKGQVASTKFILKNIRLKPDLYTVGLWLGRLDSGNIDGIRYATAFRMEALREDIMYATPFPGVYFCEFNHQIQLLQ